MEDLAEVERLKGLYAELRDRLLDLSGRNPLINFKHRAASKRQLRFVETTLDGAYRRINGPGVEIKPIPEPDDTPRDETTPEFKANLERMRASDEAYQSNLKTAQENGDEDSPLIAKAERLLRNAVRELLQLPPRPSTRDTTPKAYAQHLGIDISFELPRSSGSSAMPRHLQALQWPDPLDAILDRLADDARLAEQEMGMSTLFCVFGFLDWFEADSSDKVVTSPLLLLPVKLDAKRQMGAKTVFRLMGRDEPLDSNLSLQKRLERDFKIVLPQLEAPSDDDDDEHSVEKYLAYVAEAVSTQKRWKVRNQITLGHFKFGRLAMYAELDPDNWGRNHPVQNPLIRSVLSGSEVAGDGGSGLGGFPDDYPIDKSECERIAPFLIHNADASQHSAMIDVMKGDNLVIQGPPGTGKSQTITNVIANAIAEGKTVLFLADKLAALEVVKRRMDSAGLGDFCLELHSDKASARHVVESLKGRWALRNEILRQSPRGGSLTDGHQEIVGYLDALHIVTPCGDTPFEVMWKSLRGKAKFNTAPIPTGISLPERLIGDPSAVTEARTAISLYARMRAAFEARYGSLNSSPWKSLDVHERLTRGSVPFALEQLMALQKAADEHAGSAIALRAYQSIEPELYAPMISALRGIEAKKPSTSALRASLDHDTDAVRDAATVTLRLVELKRANAHKIDLQACSDVELEAVRDFCALAERLDQGASTPDQFNAEVTRASASARALVTMLDQLQPALAIAGFHEASQANGILILSSALQRLARIEAPLRLWAMRASEAAVAQIIEIQKRWEVLAADEARYRGRYPNASNWPTHQQIDQVRGFLSKGMLFRLIGGLSGDRRPIDALSVCLGVSPAALQTDGELEQLGRHVSSLSQFLGDRRLAQVFGSYWRGLDTPIPAHVEALSGAQEVRRIISAGEGATWLAEELEALADDDLQKLLGYRRALGLLEALPEHTLDLLRTSTLAEIRKSAGSSSEALATLAGIELPDNVRESKAAVQSIGSGVVAETEIRALTGRLRALPPSLVALMISTPSSAQDLYTAAGWIAAVKATGLPAGIEAALLRDPDERDHLVLALTKANTASERVGGLKRRLREDYGIGRLADGIEALAEQIGHLVAAQSQLGEIAGLLTQKQTIVGKGLGSFLAFLEGENVASAEFTDAFERWVISQRAAALRLGSPALRDASGIRLDAVRADFIDRDRGKLAADREEIRYRLMKRMPPVGIQHGPRKHWTDMGLLKNEFGKERRFVPVRDLLRRAGGAVQALKPCLMMSPLSLAKFVKAGALRFDVLVIDEASQMRPEDALGGLLRASQIVVVGDPKQLPPTDFFARTGGDDGGAADDEDQHVGESILELCQKTFQSTRMLRWHYRSQCESLIAFSNKHFYRGELITFPTAKPRSFAVDHQFAGGTYVAGRNDTEAKRIVELALDIIRSRAREGKRVPSIGIVAVNSDQRDLIKSEWKLRSQDDDAIDRFLEVVEERGEEFFIKNLENVQGDERDIILISMTYGPAPGQTRPHQRFGPIGGKNGHRRLNVLFSRARERIVLVTSLRASDVIPKEGSADGVGVRTLHEYLRYAEAGGQEVADDVGGEPDSDFEVAVRDRLAEAGFTVHTQVGVSGYRIDLGVINPDRPGEYLAGVECDGATYHSSKSARDRDRLRQDCLRDKGWDLIRIWSTDWFEDADTQTANVVRQLEELRLRAQHRALEESALRERERAAAATSRPSANVMPFEQSRQALERTSAELIERPDFHELDATYAGYTPQTDGAVLPEPGEAETDDRGAIREGEVPASIEAAIEDYVATVLGDAGYTTDAEQFYAPAYLQVLRHMVDKVIANEGPIFHDLLVTRIARHHGFARNGALIVERVDRATNSRYPRTQEDGRTVIWPAGVSTNLLVPFRGGVPQHREIADVPTAELASVAQSFLARGFLEGEVLSSMRQHFGLSKLRETTRVRFEAAVRLASLQVEGSLKNEMPSDELDKSCRLAEAEDA